MTHQRWKFAQDMTHDGQFTISDIEPIVQYVFFLPGDMAIDTLVGTKVGKFLELSTAAYGGWGSGAVSALAWIVAIVIFAGIWGTLEEEFARKDD